MPTLKQQQGILERNKLLASTYKRSDEDELAHAFFTDRKSELKEARQNVLGMNIETVWRAADKAYIPHDLSGVSKGKKVLVSDDELGWRSTPIRLGKSGDWQEDSAPTNPYVKIQTAISIMVDRNPKGVFKAFAKKFEAASLLHKELHSRNWEIADSREMLKVVLLNAFKYGIIAGHTAPLVIKRKVRDLVATDPDVYEETEVVVYDDVYRWPLDPWTTWFDNMARPGDPLSMNDWMRYRDFSWTAFVEQFGDKENFKFVIPKGSQGNEESEAGSSGPTTTETVKKDIVRVWYYENLARDMFYIETDEGVVLSNVPIPRLPRNKRLSCWVAPLALRHSSTIMGIGMYEAMRNNYKLYMKVRNMTMDQLVLSIYKSFFYSGTNTLKGTGEMVISPGGGIQVTDAKNISYNEVPGPGRDAWAGLEFIQQEIDDDTGISKTLEGELSPKAKAFDIAQAREASLKRLKTPLDNIGYALEQDAYISVGLYEEIYSIPEIEIVTDPKRIEEYRKEVLNGELLAKNVSESGDPETEETQLEVKKFREFPLNLEKDKEGELAQTKEERFFQIDPDDLPWEGKISIKGQSIIPESPLLEKQNILEMSNLLIPLFEFPFEIVGKAAMQILKQYDQEPEDWLPVEWLAAMAGEGQEQPQAPPLFVPQEAASAGGGQPQGAGIPKAPKVVSSVSKQPGQEGSQVRRLLGKLNPFGRNQ